MAAKKQKVTSASFGYLSELRHDFLASVGITRLRQFGEFC